MRLGKDVFFVLLISPSSVVVGWGASEGTFVASRGVVDSSPSVMLFLGVVVDLVVGGVVVVGGFVVTFVSEIGCKGLLTPELVGGVAVGCVKLITICGCAESGCCGVCGGVGVVFFVVVVVVVNTGVIVTAGVVTVLCTGIIAVVCVVVCTVGCGARFGS